MYADDHQLCLYTTGKDHDTVGNILQRQGQKALDWYNNNHQVIKKTKEIKLLGVNINENLNFASPISELYAPSRVRK
jgi:hypothetical protein